jgi:uncharacterized protein YcbK (DUF882 family)
MSLRVPSIAAASFALSLGLGASLLNAAPDARGADGRVAAGPVATDSVVRRAHPSDVALSEVVRVNEQALGRSGALRLAVVRVMERVDASYLQSAVEVEGVTYRWKPVFGTQPEPIGGELRLTDEIRAPTTPGYWRLLVRRGEEQHEVDGLTLVTKVPFSDKRAGRLNGYLIGTYPTEGSGRADRYAPPAGFIEVTPETRDVHVSKHLRLGQFLTKDQFAVWPKYVALDLHLIDKLELVMHELHAMGVRAERIHIMSGFRTPNYNGPGEGGRALLSRHTYGDAADIWIENGTRTGYIADLNGDGRQDIQDAEVIVQAVERVEQKHPELVGGVGLYRDSGARGPFVHVDVRGARSRW